MKARLGAALLCLLFAVPFGGVGAGATWVLVRMLQDAQGAEDWVRVQAKVESFGNGKVSYRYRYNGVDFHGERLGANPIGGTDDIDSWHDDMNAMLAQAQAGEKPLMVWVNPAQPSESMVDREIRWKLVLFIIPFALGFGGVGVGAFLMLLLMVFTPTREVAAEPGTTVEVPAEKGSGVMGLWVFTFFWNVISFPIAMLVVPSAIEGGEWFALLVVIFPLIGVLMLWSAIATTIKAIGARFGAKPEAEFEMPATSAAPRHEGFAHGMIDDPRRTR